MSTDTKINRNDVKNEKETEKWNWTFFLLKVKGHSNLNVKSFQLFNGCRANISKIGPAISPLLNMGKDDKILKGTKMNFLQFSNFWKMLRLLEKTAEKGWIRILDF